MASTRSALALLSFAALMLAWPGAAAAQSAVADLRSASGESIASATFTQASQDVLIAIAFRNRTALVGSHAVEIHSAGSCDPPAFDTAGPAVINLPGLVIGPAGVGVYNIAAPSTTLNALLGRSLVIFDQADATAGPRIACAVIGGQPASTDRPDLLTSVGIAVMGGLLIAGGVLLRRGA